MSALTTSENPIAWQETIHQTRSAPHTLRHWSKLGPLILASMIVLVVLTLHDIEFSTREFAIFCIWFVQIATAMRALIAGANAISREHVNLTWDTLVLTGVSARQILLGKWFAAMRRVAPWMLALGVIRLAFIPVFLMGLVNFWAWQSSLYSNYNGYSSSYYDEPCVNVIVWVPWAHLLAVIMSVALTILEVMCCTAIGLAASAIARRGITAMAWAIMIRFAPIMLLVAFTRYQLGGGAHSYAVLRFAPFTIADGGTAPLSRLSVPLTPMSCDTHGDALLGLAFATLLIFALLVGSLVVAWAAIRLTGALPATRRTVVKNITHR